MRLADENRIDILRQKAVLLEFENARLVQEIVRLNKDLLEAKKADQEQLQQALALLEKQLAAAAAKLEERARSAEDQASSEGTNARGTKNKKEPKEKQIGHGPRAQPDLPIREEIHPFKARDEKCSVCGGAPTLLVGMDDETEEIDVIERQFVLKKHVRHKRKCTCGCIEMAPMPPRLVPGGRYSNNFALETVAMKFIDQTPFDRIARIFGREGLVIDSQTLWDQALAFGRKVEPAWERLREEALREYVVGLDQTHWKLIGEKKYMQMWELSTPRIAYFDIADTKSEKDGARILEGFKGKVMCDAMSTHECLAKTGLTLAHCWAHPRRKAEDLRASDPARAEKIIGFIKELYEIDAEADGDEEKLRALRDDKSRSVLRRFDAWILEQRLLPSSPTAQLLQYLARHRPGFERFLDDPKIPLDNNQTERGYLWVAVGRRAFIGSKSKLGTRIAAIFYSLAESARRNALDPKLYLRTALDAALKNETIPLPHELARPANSAAAE